MVLVRHNRTIPIWGTTIPAWVSSKHLWNLCLGSFCTGLLRRCIWFLYFWLVFKINRNARWDRCYFITELIIVGGMSVCACSDVIDVTTNFVTITQFNHVGSWSNSVIWHQEANEQRLHLEQNFWHTLSPGKNYVNCSSVMNDFRYTCGIAPQESWGWLKLFLSDRIWCWIVTLKALLYCSCATVLVITNVIIVNNFVDNINSKYIVAMAMSHLAANMAHRRHP